MALGSINLTNTGGIDVFTAKLGTLTNLDKQNSSNAEVMIFLNPFSEEIKITINNNDISEIILYDITSRELWHRPFSKTAIINTELPAKGIYFYEVRNKKGVIKNGKVIRQ